MANIKQVAARASLSVSCVSKYLKNPDSVLPASREKIETAIAQLNYVPSTIARNLRVKRTGVIKIITHSITNPFFAEIFELLRKQFEENGYISVLQVIAIMETIEFKPSDFEQVDGIILCFPENDEVLFSLNSAAPAFFPIVCIHGHKPVENFITIITDFQNGSRIATDYVISLGCKNIVYIGGPAQSSISILKFSGFNDAISNGPADVYCSAVFRGSYDIRSGYNLAKNLICHDNLPDAVICENDVLAAGVIHRLVENNIHIPEQIHITGFDNIPLAEMFIPPLTSIAIPFVELCSAACEELLALLNNKNAVDHFITPKLIIRQS